MKPSTETLTAQVKSPFRRMRPSSARPQSFQSPRMNISWCQLGKQSSEWPASGTQSPTM